MAEPRTLEQAIADEVADITAEMRRIDDRMAALRWGSPAAHRTGGGDWQDFALGPPVDRDDGGQLAGEVLRHKRMALQHQLERLKSRLTGTAVSERKGWG